MTNCTEGFCKSYENFPLSKGLARCYLDNKVPTCGCIHMGFNTGDKCLNMWWIVGPIIILTVIIVVWFSIAIMVLKRRQKKEKEPENGKKKKLKKEESTVQQAHFQIETPDGVVVSPFHDDSNKAESDIVGDDIHMFEMNEKQALGHSNRDREKDRERDRERETDRARQVSEHGGKNAKDNTGYERDERKKDGRVNRQEAIDHGDGMRDLDRNMDRRTRSDSDWDRRMRSDSDWDRHDRNFNMRMFNVGQEKDREDRRDNERGRGQEPDRREDRGRDKENDRGGRDKYSVRDERDRQRDRQTDRDRNERPHPSGSSSNQQADYQREYY